MAAFIYGGSKMSLIYYSVNEKSFTNGHLAFYFSNFNLSCLVCVSGQGSVSKWTQHTTRTKSSGYSEDLCEGDEAPHPSPRIRPYPSLPRGCRAEAATASLLFLHPAQHSTEYPDRRADGLPHARAPLQAKITIAWTLGQLLS